MGGSAFFVAFKKRIHSKLRNVFLSVMGLFMSWLFYYYYLIPMAEGHISWGTWLGPRAYDHLCVWEALPSLLPSRRGFIALAQKSNTNIDIINHNILRGKAKAII